jgi:hypothetical protein
MLTAIRKESIIKITNWSYQFELHGSWINTNMIEDFRLQIIIIDHIGVELLVMQLLFFSKNW